MIRTDQPTYFPPELLIAVSSKDDGTMLNRIRGRHVAEVLENRRQFCDQIGVKYDDVVYHVISYDQAQTFDSIAEVTETDTVKYNNEGIFADALYTETAGVGLFLPVADCIATVIYDPKRRALMLAHLGRHSTVAQLMTRAIQYFVEHGSQAKDLQIWMSPSITQKNYRMDYFDHVDNTKWRNFCHQTADGIYMDMQGFNRSLAVQSGVPSDNIFISSIDTADDPNYFSHSAGDTGGRFAVLAEIKSTK
ncbi:polyphenol oxidase family protein [Candidatus Nanosynsacchari sp. TM7_ANC_38.39_G1_1]|uniref:polyphenol oxidase family protein n=1 Tax=Candidatus Nanosynsacchari sp. TM7_ANC_38.39_G1_1 TaxID=1986206 RepID=UPI00101BC0C1|nr:polyphenol oxidase family protein [Candidatus Nanosynsacchari sp. TM7_ANC_38.39_G1_1]RYC74073.1 Laccase domain protein [Candidatus Nanosynsacchari sp. TM7_ANC_38.39_G1_1]